MLHTVSAVSAAGASPRRPGLCRCTLGRRAHRAPGAPALAQLAERGSPAERDPAERERVIRRERKE